MRAMVYLACHGDGKPVALRDISADEGISLSYLEQLFGKLRKGRVVRSVRGPGGGYVLARPTTEINVAEIITTVEEPLNPVACLDDDSSGCERAKRCSTQRVWKGLGEKIYEFLSSVTIEDLKKQAKAAASDGEAGGGGRAGRGGEDRRSGPERRSC